jgi:hypothetical protein
MIVKQGRMLFEEISEVTAQLAGVAFFKPDVREADEVWGRVGIFFR